MAGPVEHCEALAGMAKDVRDAYPGADVIVIGEVQGQLVYFMAAKTPNLVAAAYLLLDRASAHHGQSEPCPAVDAAREAGQVLANYMRADPLVTSVAVQ